MEAANLARQNKGSVLLWLKAYKATELSLRTRYYQELREELCGKV